MSDFFTFVAGAAIGGLLSWLITHRYYLKSGQDQKRELERLSEKLKAKNTLSDFEDLLESSQWSKETINNSEVWVAAADNTFQIVQGERTREFVERWTKVYPDGNSSAYPVYLKINGNVIKELTFISVDGGRIFVPMPEVRPKGQKDVDYFWNMNSLSIKVCKIVGTYYIYKDIPGVAQRSGITLVE